MAYDRYKAERMKDPEFKTAYEAVSAKIKSKQRSSYEFHGGDLYIELLDQFGNHHGDYRRPTDEELIEELADRGYSVVSDE